MRRALLVLLSAALAFAALPGNAAQGAAFTPGAAGIGDPYFPLDGNGGYDVAAYDLTLGYTPATNTLTGTARIRAEATQDLSTFNLDFRGLTVREITVNGQPAQWTRSGAELTVEPAAGLPDGSTFSTVVRYDGVPTRVEGVGFIHTDDGAVVVGEPHVAATWFPVNDHPSDKASYVFRVTVPAGLEVVANGLPRGRTTAGGRTTWTWQAAEPMASYLATATIGEFQLTSRTVDGIQYIDALDVDLLGTSTGTSAQGSFAREPEIIAYLSSVFGPYPFSASGGLVDDNFIIGFALENQTRPIYARTFFSSPGSGTSVVAHELAHQWYGDSVAVDAWQHIWLNEGFATYAQWLWSEHEGEASAQEIFDDEYGRSQNDPFWDLTIGDPGPKHLFDGAVYDRGAMTLHALRGVIGDADFFALLPAWAQSREDGNGTTPEFIALAEKISGQQLDAFFDAWLFTGSKPAGF